MGLSAQEEEECVALLKKSVLLQECKEEHLRKLVKQMVKKQYKKGDILINTGEPQKKMFVIATGTAVRERDINGQSHHIDTHLGGSTVGSLHVMGKDSAYATTKCQTDVVTYELPSEVINTYFDKNPSFAFDVVRSLTLEIRRYTKAMRTPLLEQHPKKTPYIPVSIAAAVESFYRAALNSILNQKLTGVQRTTLFPNMHIQLPTRIVYINGFKGIRQYLDANVHPDDYSNPNTIRLAAAITPGVLMTPFSSILEASNAGHANPEPLYRRITRGLVPRTGREIIFGIGLNQLSDYCEERIPYFDNQALRNASGSLLAGVISGYLSHVVHNMSTLKLMNPAKSYPTHFREYVQKYDSKLPKSIPEGLRPIVRLLGSLIIPAGVTIRTSQIVGSFIILNGTINAMQKYLL